MKMLQHAGEEEMAGSGGCTVMVGVKLDSQSRELLTWALVKVAQPGDTVTALHVLSNNEIVDREGRSSLLSLVKGFDSVLAVYEGFCNLKQVNLKLKICRGPSVRKILVREAKSCTATKLILGVARNHHIRSSTSVAKYCAKKLSKDCSVLAANNGKIVFHREAAPATSAFLKGTEDCRQSGLLNAIHRSISANSSKVLSESGANEALMCDQGDEQNLQQALAEARSNSLQSIMKQNCSICGPAAQSSDNYCNISEEEANDADDESLAIVPLSKPDAPPSHSTSLLVRQLPEQKPGWPLLRRAVLPDQQLSDKSSLTRISVVQWAMRLPSRQISISSANLDCRRNDCDQDDEKSNPDRESRAIVPVGVEVGTAPPSPNHSLKNLPKELEGLHEKYSATCRLFKYRELLSATSNFLSENLIGRGGSSQVYKGCLPDGKEFAVKILKPSEDVLKEFVLEIEIITTLHHKNIISLLGFCYEDDNLLLVYDFLPRGSLVENLHGDKKNLLAFGWSERYKVAVGVAEALDYLHNCCTQPVIHRDVKSSNILLSDDFEPQLSDFGLAKWASSSASHIICTDVAGTFGYLAPEYFMYGKVNEKIDVFAFGVVLLELLSGRKPISNDQPKGQESLVMWAKPLLNGGKISKLLDQSLGDNYDCDQLERMVLAATLCIRHAPRARPQISLVLKLLQGDAEVIRWARLEVNAAEESDILDDEGSPSSNLQSHLNLALLDLEDDSLSMSSIEQNISLEDYLQGRWSRSSSFD